jgi:peptidoglycan/xylan/chitin deacetylase (PgdA/CDA1 family)
MLTLSTADEVRVPREPRATATDGSPGAEPLPPPLALAYHGVDDRPLRSDPHALFVRPQDLERQIRRLEAWGYRLVTFGQLAKGVAEGRGRGLAALTFDDGLADNLHSLVPILRTHGITATVFVVSGWLGQPHPYAPGARVLTADELRTLHAGGVEIGSHTVTHADLSALDYSKALDELATSKHDLEAVLDGPVEAAAYPFGRATETTLAACGEAGYRAACRISGEGRWDQPLNLPRQDMDNGATLFGLRLKRDDRYEPLMRSRVGRLVPGLVRAGRRMAGR